MSSEQVQKPSTLLNVVDKDMHDSILRLDRKLKSLQIEINAKVDEMAEEKDKAAIERRKQLVILSYEVSKALNSIHKLVNIVVSENLTDGEFIKMNQAHLESLREIVKDNVDKIAKIQEQF